MTTAGTIRARARVMLTLTAMMIAGGAATARASYGPGLKGEDAAVPQVGLQPRLDTQVPLDATFRNEEGKVVPLSDYFAAGRPVIVTPVYYGCTSVCTETLNRLVQGLAGGPRGLVLGKDFEIVTISINPEETAEMAKEKRASYLKNLGQPKLEGGWHFLTGEEKQIRRVTNALGFYYAIDLEKGYDHAQAIYILTPKGRISSAITQPTYTEPEVVLADQLAHAANGKIGSMTQIILRTCGLMKYDPKTGQFVHNPWMWAATIGGVLIFITVATFIGSLWMGEYKKAKQARNQDGKGKSAVPAKPAGI